MRIATDIGGTFTDLVTLDEDGNVTALKGDTTPPDFERGVMNVMARLGAEAGGITAFIHGTTTIINALTERKGAKTGLLTTKGFRDVLEIARCNRPDLFNLVFAKPKPFVPRHLRLEVAERISADGGTMLPLDMAGVESAAEIFRRESVEAVAVCFINSYANDAHELAAAARLRELLPGVFVSSSGQITREWREYERTSTVVLNAYVGPIASRYVSNLDGELDRAGVRGRRFFMQSNGGTTPFEGAKIAPVNMVESGPVAGVFGSAALGGVIGERRVISFDVGGTTAKCSLIDGGEVKITTNYRIERTDRNAGYPIMAPVVDIVEIGNGGGSIAWMDETGSLRVGPRSAGALPGPVAYGRGGLEPTTTDACLVAGRLSPSNFDSKVDLAAVEAALVRRVGEPLGKDARGAAESVIRVAEANMYNALKLISVRRGYDPREFTLVAFGGGGPMHAAAMARELGVRKVVIPVAAAVFSAWGMLMTGVRHDYIRTRISPLIDTPPEELSEMWSGLLEDASRDFARHGEPDDSAEYGYFADMRYMGQEHTVKVQTPQPAWDEAAKAEISRRFHDAHERYYTYRLDGAPIEIVNLHLVARGGGKAPEPARIARQSEPIASALKERRSVYFSRDGWRDTPVYRREALLAGAELAGPAIVEERAASTLAGDGQALAVDDYGNLIITEAN
jgi:N-methylhydantoinase A